MSDNRHQPEAVAPTKKWIAQAGVLVGVLVLIVAVIILKNRASEAVSLAVNDSQVATGQAGQATAAPRELPQEQLDRLLAAGQPTLAFFHSNNCVECIKMIKIVNDVYPEFESSVALVDVNVYDPLNRSLLRQAKVQYIPTQIFYNAAGEGNLTVGAMPAQVFRRYMRVAAGEE